MWQELLVKKILKKGKKKLFRQLHLHECSRWSAQSRFVIKTIVFDHVNTLISFEKIERNLENITISYAPCYDDIFYIQPT